MTRHPVDLDARYEMPAPGTLYVVVDTDYRNRRFDIQPAEELGGPRGVDGYHVMDTSQVFSFVPDHAVSATRADGGAVATADKQLQVVGRHQHPGGKRWQRSR